MCQSTFNITVVADTAMVDDDRLVELREKGLSYIVGARLANSDLGTVKKIHSALDALSGTLRKLSIELLWFFISGILCKHIQQLQNIIIKKITPIIRDLFIGI